MIDLRIGFVYLFLKILVSGRGVVNQEINSQNIIEEHSTGRYEESPIKFDDILHIDQEIMMERNDGLRRQRRGLLPNLFQGSLDTGLLLPVGINAQLGAGINLPLDQSILPDGKVSCGIPGELTAVPYPVQLYVVNPQNQGKMSSDTKINTPVTFNPFSNNRKDNSIPTLKLNNLLENNQNLISVPLETLNTILDSVVNKSQDIVNNTTLQIDIEKSSNVSKEESLNQTTSLNNEDDYVLKNTEINGVGENPSLNNSTFSEATQYANNMVPLCVVLKPANKSNDFNRSITIDSADNLQNNCDSKPIYKKTEYMTIDKPIPDTQNINTFVETKNQANGMDCARKKYGVYYGYDKNRNIYPNFIYPMEVQNSYGYLRNEPKNIPVYYNFINQEYANRTEYKYPFEDEIMNKQNYGPAKIHKSDSNTNDVRKQNSDVFITPRILKLHNTNTNPSYGLVNLNYGNAGESKLIQYGCNQHYPFIGCNGFYINQNIPRTYPSYFIYPHAYVNGCLY